MTRVRLILLVLALAVALPSTALAHGSSTTTSARGAILGQHKILTILVTWGPETFTREHVHKVVYEDTAQWIARSSFGKTSFTGDTTPWLKVFATKPTCNEAAIQMLARPAAVRAGFNPASYDRVIYLVAANIGCNYSGLASGNEVFLNGALSRKLVAHELGHTYGLGHANRWDCTGGPCRSVEYGDPFDTMGGGSGDFNAYEKFLLKWLPNIARATADGTYSIDQLEQPSSIAQAFVVTTARHEYWIDHRREVPGGFSDTSFLNGVIVRAGPNPTAPLQRHIYPQSNLLIPDPVGKGRPSVLVGETWGEAGAFEVTVVGSTITGVDLQFRWVDGTPPQAVRFAEPLAVVRAGKRRTLEVSWDEPVETGSGVAYYEVALNKAAARRVATGFTSGHARFTMPKPGRHTVTVVAVDRAGNRSPAATRRFTVKK